jgi:hypothetical protein
MICISGKFWVLVFFLYSSMALNTFTLLCIHSQQSAPEQFLILPTETPGSLSNISPCPHFTFSLCVCSLYTQLSETMHCLSFDDWLIPFRLSLQFIHVVLCGRISFFLKQNNIPLCVLASFLYPFSCWWTFGLLLPFDYKE